METAPRRRGRPPRNRPEAAKPDILANATQMQVPAPQIDASAQMQNPHAPPLSDYAQNLADAAKAIMNDERPDLRPELRPEMRMSSAERAAKRAAELWESTENAGGGQDKFYIPPERIPDGWTLEWKRHTTINREDPTYWGEVLRMGWEPVSAEDFPDMVIGGGNQKIVEREGMILMQRPAIITKRAKEKAEREARMQVLQKESEVASKPLGTDFERQHEKLPNTVKKSWQAPIPVPD